MSTENLVPEPTPESRKVDKVFINTLKIIAGLGLLALLAAQARSGGEQDKFDEILDACRSSNEYVVMHHSGNSRVEFEMDCKITVYRGTPVEFGGGER